MYPSINETMNHNYGSYTKNEAQHCSSTTAAYFIKRDRQLRKRARTSNRTSAQKNDERQLRYPRGPSFRRVVSAHRRLQHRHEKISALLATNLPEMPLPARASNDSFSQDDESDGAAEESQRGCDELCRQLSSSVNSVPTNEVSDVRRNECSAKIHANTFKTYYRKHVCQQTNQRISLNLDEQSARSHMDDVQVKVDTQVSCKGAFLNTADSFAKPINIKERQQVKVGDEMKPETVKDKTIKMITKKQERQQQLREKYNKVDHRQLNRWCCRRCRNFFALCDSGGRPMTTSVDETPTWELIKTADNFVVKTKKVKDKTRTEYFIECRHCDPLLVLGKEEFDHRKKQLQFLRQALNKPVRENPNQGAPRRAAILSCIRQLQQFLSPIRTKFHPKFQAPGFLDAQKNKSEMSKPTLGHRKQRQRQHQENQRSRNKNQKPAELQIIAVSKNCATASPSAVPSAKRQREVIEDHATDSTCGDSTPVVQCEVSSASLEPVPDALSRHKGAAAEDDDSFKIKKASIIQQTKKREGNLSSSNSNNKKLASKKKVKGSATATTGNDVQDTLKAMGLI